MVIILELANGCLEIFVALIIFILYISTRNKNTQDSFDKRLSATIVFHILVLILDAMRWFLYQHTDLKFLLIFLSVTPTILSLIGNAIFVYFIVIFLSQRGPLSQKVTYPLVFQFAFAIIVWTTFILYNGISSALNMQTNYDFMNYSWAYWIGHAAWASVCIFGIVIIFRCKENLKPKELWSLLSYCIFPLIALVLRFFWDGPQIFLSTSLAFIWIYVVLQRDQQQRFEEQEGLLIQSRIAILMSQIQPHFLYNTLTVICGLCDENPKEAKIVTAEFADYLRHNLDSLNETTPIPFSKELQHVQLYLNIEKKRFEDRLNIRYNISASEFLIPSLTVQPIVENAIKHGILKTKNGGEVTISTLEKSDCYEIIVSDNGVGFNINAMNTDNKTHIGIVNVRERLWRISHSTLTIESEINKGTNVTIKLPKGDVRK